MRPLACAAVGLLLALPCARAAESGAAPDVPDVPDAIPVLVVTPGLRAEDAFAVPASVTALDVDLAGRGGPGVGLSETLRRVPGVLSRSRQNHAQDEQLSIRGFGARSSFGVRGVRLLVDGIPATMPDGQGQMSHVDLASAARVEVLRGPFSALYGNAAGGVVQVFSAGGTPEPEWSLRLGGGSHGLERAHASARGRTDVIDYSVATGVFRSDGFRRHSRAERRHGNARLEFPLRGDGRLVLLANAMDQPLAEDPQGLTAAQFRTDPRQASAQALAFDTRKEVRQNQGGAIYERALGAQVSLRAMAYWGERDMRQFLAVPVAAQASPLSAGGVVGLDGDYGGADLRASHEGRLRDRPFALTLGLAADHQRQHRQGWENFAAGQLGVVGSLRRDQRDAASSRDVYAQLRWEPVPRWALNLGARSSEVRLRSRDRYITASNPDDSGRATYRSTRPVAGLVFQASPAWRAYASFGRGFETPTLSEVAYRPDAASGLNLDLRPATTASVELGVKWRGHRDAMLDLALFDAATRAEIAVLASAGGRTVYHNVGRSRRRGLEAMLRLPLGEAWTLHAAWTWLDAHYRDGFGACDAAGRCAVPAGARIPGVPRAALAGELRWSNGRGLSAALHLDAVGRMPADDAGRTFAPGFATLGFSAGQEYDLGQYRLAPFVRIDNAFSRSHVGSVIVNQASGASLEPAPGRSMWLGIRVSRSAR